MSESHYAIWIGPPLAKAQFAFGIIAVAPLWLILFFFTVYALLERTRDRLLALFALVAKSMHQLLLVVTTGIISEDVPENEANPLLGGDQGSYHRTVVTMLFFGCLADISLLAVILRTLHSRHDALHAKVSTIEPAIRFPFFGKSAGWVLWGFTSMSDLVAQALLVDDAWFNVTNTTDARFPKNSPDFVLRSIWTIFRTLLFTDILLLSFGLYARGRKAGFRDRIVSNFVRIATPCIAIQAIWGVIYRIVTAVATLPNEDSASALNLMGQLANDFPMIVAIVLFVAVSSHSQWATLISIYYEPKPTYPSA